jgi:hypothetical protein
MPSGRGKIWTKIFPAFTARGAGHSSSNAARLESRSVESRRVNQEGTFHSTLGRLIYPDSLREKKMGVYDQASRYCVKMDPRGFFRWLLPQNEAPVFCQWLDTRTIPFPGARDRVCDTVAGFANPGAELPCAALVVEFQTEPEGDVLERLLEYNVRVRRELRQVADGRSEKLPVAAALINLTGGPQPDAWTMQPVGFSGAGHSFRVIQRIMSLEDAAMTLEQIRRGVTARCILPWIPLMNGGDSRDVIQRWKDLAVRDSNAQCRADYGGLALVFSELLNCHGLWKQALEGWNMRESQQVLEWQEEARHEGRQEGRQEMLLNLLQVQFGSPLPESLVAEVRTLEDERELSRWMVAALRSATLGDFLGRVNGHP